MKIVFASIIFLLLSQLFLIVAIAQNKPSNREQPKVKTEQSAENVDDEVISIETSLVTIPVSVSDEKGRYILDLQQNDFQIYEDGKKQEIAYFHTLEEPLAIVILLDLSGSTFYHHLAIKQASLNFIQVLRPQDAVLPLAFGSVLQAPLTKSTNDKKLLRKAVNSFVLDKAQDTKVYDTLAYVSKNILKNAVGRKALIIPTDGLESGSSTTRDAAKQYLLESQTSVYTLYYDTKSMLGLQAKNRESDLFRKQPDFSNFPNRSVRSVAKPGGEKESRKAVEFLHSITEPTGGRFYEASNEFSIAASFDKIADELRRQYSIGYYPENTIQIGKREIQVTVNRPDVKIRARRSFVYSPLSTGKQSN